MKKSTLYSWLSAACFGIPTLALVSWMVWSDLRSFLLLMRVLAVMVLVFTLIVLGVGFANESAKARENGQ